MSCEVVGVHVSPAHTFSKQTVDAITLHEGLGVEGDAHFGATVQHRSRVAADPSQPNMRQVHLIHAELFDDLVHGGFHVMSGDLGENITTRGIDLLGLPSAHASPSGRPSSQSQAYATRANRSTTFSRDCSSRSCIPMMKGTWSVSLVSWASSREAARSARALT